MWVRLRSLVPVSASEICHPGEESGDHFWGFHETESFRGRSFRWSRPLACLMIETPRSDLEICIETDGVRRLSSSDVRVFWNGHLAKSDDARSSEERLVFIAPEAHFTDAGPQVLTLISRSLTGRHSRDSRRLGLPIFSISFLQRVPDRDPETVLVGDATPSSYSLRR